MPNPTALDRDVAAAGIDPAMVVQDGPGRYHVYFGVRSVTVYCDGDSYTVRATGWDGGIDGRYPSLVAFVDAAIRR